MARQDLHYTTIFAFSISPWTVHHCAARYSYNTLAWIALVRVPLFALMLVNLTVVVAGFAVVQRLHSRTWQREDLAAAILQVKYQSIGSLPKIFDLHVSDLIYPIEVDVVDPSLHSHSARHRPVQSDVARGKDLMDVPSMSSSPHPPQPSPLPSTFHPNPSSPLPPP